MIKKVKVEISTGRKLTEEDDKKILDLYVNKNLSSVQIGRILGTSHRSVLNHLESMGVDRRTLSESHFAYHNKEIPHEFCDYNSMHELYVNNHMTKEQLGTKFNCAPHVIDRVLRTLGIEVRGASAAKIGVQRGEKHHNWKGGTSSLYSLCREYFQTNIAPVIRKRDQYTCQLCGCHSNLHVHHIKYFSDILDEIISEYPHYAKIVIYIIYMVIIRQSEAKPLKIRGTFNDYSERKYIQADGNGGRPGWDGDIV